MIRSPFVSSNSSRRFGAALVSVALLAVAAVGCQKKSDGESETPASPGVQASGKKPFPDDAPITEAPAPASKPENPLKGAKLFVDPESLSMLQAKNMRRTDAAKADILDKIAKQPQALWMGEWNSNIFRAVEHFVKRAKAEGSVPVMIAYNIPLRDCGQYSKGGLSGKEAYQRWIRNVAAGIGDDAAVVILEPDALGHFQECLSPEQKSERMFLLKDAVKVLRQNAKTAVYLDAGHAQWATVEEMVPRLKEAGIEYANGFSLNVSNYVTTQENTVYGKKISEQTGGSHFVIDTSRNGNGTNTDLPADIRGCNPPGRKIGQAPTTETGDPLIDGYLWLKRPGESDGECQGGPKAGVFWLEQALQLAQ
jgi:endoglucanase